MLKLTLVAVACVAAFSLACGGDDGDDEPFVGATAIAVDVDPEVLSEAPLIITAAVRSDAIELARLTSYSEQPCRTFGDTAEAPRCEGEESENDVVLTFLRSGCNREWLRPPAVANEYEQALAAGGEAPEVVAVYDPTDAGGELDADRVVVFRTGSRGGATAAFALHLLNGKVVSIEPGCDNPNGLVAAERVDEWFLQPEGGI
jgi:hypothetical protein